MEFDWDDKKSEANLQLRGFGFEIAAEIFAGDIITKIDSRKNYKETRIQAIGENAYGDVLFVVYTVRDGAIRIISARPASRKERTRWSEKP